MKFKVPSISSIGAGASSIGKIAPGFAGAPMKIITGKFDVNGQINNIQNEISKVMDTMPDVDINSPEDVESLFKA